jgi:hypothetical protein
MNYSIIKDEQLFKEFLNWLPELRVDECYYLCLFARSKYAKNEDGSNKFPHIKTDKAQLKRITVHKKSLMLEKIKQMECEFGAYKTKDGDNVPQEALALYITPNPRNQKKAMFNLIKRIADIQIANATGYNIHAEAMSAIQKSKSRTCFVDFDVDFPEGEEMDFLSLKLWIEDRIGKKSEVYYLRTRGGYHVLVNPDKIEKQYQKSWYKEIIKNSLVDIKGDCMIPVPGATQGNFIPYFEN